MKTEKAHKRALKHILCCIIILIIFVLTITFHVEAKTNDMVEKNLTQEDIVPLKPQLATELLKLEKINKNEIEVLVYDTPRIIEKNIDFYIEENINTIEFFSKVFGFNIEFVKNNLINRSKFIGDIDETNIASLKKDDGEIKHFSNVNYGIVEYFYYLKEHYPQENNIKRTHYIESSEYIEKLIIYYTNIYTNVDTTMALSIGAAESGYYKAKYMISIGNIYGGMGSNGLIKYKNIEYGVLSYVRYLSKNYYSKGLNTIELIGSVYCPTINDYGNKVASPHWISLVNKAKNKYSSYTQNITILELINY